MRCLFAACLHNDLKQRTCSLLVELFAPRPGLSLRANWLASPMYAHRYALHRDLIRLSKQLFSDSNLFDSVLRG